jgi:beta-glucosidase
VCPRRWGRNQETFGEEPSLNGRYGVAISQGYQNGEDARYIKTLITLKHWDAYNVEGYPGSAITRHNFDAIVSQYALADTFFVAWKAAIVEGGALGVMCR